MPDAWRWLAYKTWPEADGPVVPFSAAPVNFVISDFRFHTAGLPECTSH